MSETPPINYPQVSVDPRGVLIPCPPEEFADFISSLLGKSQICEGLFDGWFEIHLKDIENFYHLVDQRLSEQNVSRLISFTVVIKYFDGTSVELPSLDHLRQHVEIRPVVSSGVLLTWIYLVGFRGRPIPERQQIDVEIQSSRGNEEDALYYSSPRSQHSHGSGYMKYRVSYTARTWGSNIENMLRSHILTLINPNSGKFSNALIKFRTAIQFLLGSVIFVAGVGIGTVLVQVITAHNTMKFKYNWLLKILT